MKNRLFALLLTSATCSFAYAGNVDHYAVHASIAPVFSYSYATASHPLVVDTVSDDGKCSFTVSLVGLQSGTVKQSSLSGRIESGQCNGQKVSKGVVQASVSPSKGDQVVLNRRLEVVVFDGISGLMSRALEEPSSENVAAYQSAHRALLDKASH